MLLTTREVAALLKVHPKQVYRLLRRGLPAHRIGDEWRFDPEEVLRYSRERGLVTPRSAEALSVEEQAVEGIDMRPAAPSPPWTPPLIAANGDLAVELLLEGARQGPGGCLGLVMADHETGLRLLGAGTVLVSGCHGDTPPPAMRGRALARLHLADREVGLAFRSGLSVHSVSAVVGARLASSLARKVPSTALHSLGIPPPSREPVFAHNREEPRADFESHNLSSLATQIFANEGRLRICPVQSREDSPFSGPFRARHAVTSRGLEHSTHVHGTPLSRARSPAFHASCITGKDTREPT